jgi:hypothetical protein
MASTSIEDDGAHDEPIKDKDAIHQPLSINDKEKCSVRARKRGLSIPKKTKKRPISEWVSIATHTQHAKLAARKNIEM